MKTKFLALWILILIGVFLSACTSSPDDASTNNANTPSTEETTDAGETAGENSVVLTVIGLDQTVTLTLDELIDLGTVEGWAGTISSTGEITPAQWIKGVRIADIAALVGGLSADVSVNLLAKDGYGITMSYDQIANGAFITYDPGTGEENSVEGDMIAVVAFERDGEAIPADEDGPLRIFVINQETNNQVIDGHWSVKWIEKIELKPATTDWMLYLEGVVTQDLDRVSFESCSAPACHQAVWTDADGNEWSGVPLYYIAGRVDDSQPHGDRAFNLEYAEAGYTIELFAADGYNVSLDSSLAIFNNAILLANKINGESLDEKNFPLRLVGDGLEKKDMAGQITNIILNPKEGVIPPAEDSGEVLDLSLPEGAVLKVVGAVRNPLVLTMDNLDLLGIQEDVTVEHPNKGALSYRGVFLKDLLAFVGLDAEASALVMHASDGYSVEAPLADVLACENCLIAINEDGTLSMAMEGMPGAMWVGNLVALQVKAGETSEAEPGEDTAVEEEPAIGMPSDATFPEGAQLEVAGLVSAAKTFSAADLNALGVVDVQVEHPKKGPLDVSGILLNDLLEAAGLNAGALTLTIVASDGYSVDVALSDVLACAKCLVIIDEDGTLATVMEGLPTSTWVKDVIKLEVK